MNYREIKQKKAWVRVRPEFTQNVFADNYYSDEDYAQNDFVTQSDFVREFYPSGHRIHNPFFYPDIYREEKIEIVDEEGTPTGRFTKKIYREPVPRYAFAFQQIILVKQLIHLCGNDIQCEFTFDNPSDKDKATFVKLRGGWLDKGMEEHFYNFCKSVKGTADAAMLFFLDGGRMGVKVYSYFDGYTIYPHYNKFGKLEVCAISYKSYDDTGNAIAEYLEVYDDTYQTILKRGVGKGKTFKEKIKGIFNADGYTLVSKEEHGFDRLPISYLRDDNGPCWSPSQGSIDGYELSFSQMAHNNQAYAFPIMYLQGEDVEAIHDINGTIKMLTMAPDDKAGFLSSPNASESFMKQLDTLERLIYEQSFAVRPPELRSGDLPAAGLKILYSPAYEKAFEDCNFYQQALNDIAELFTYCYGLEAEETIAFDNLQLKWWIKPYVHVNWSAVISEMSMAVQNGFLSKQTASERIQEYGIVGEWDRIMMEKRKENEEEVRKELTTLMRNNEE